ncbi:MAG TPA: hypothetical protein VHA11_03970 [Bryobacteraceae bacterium]|nr:hypothetical protein [Bryobacteraceae bacterium]
MKRHRLNLLTALGSLGGSAVWFATGQSATGFIWLVASLIWLGAATMRFRLPAEEPAPAKRLARRLSRMLLWG